MPNLDSKLHWGPTHTNSDVICAIDTRISRDDDLSELIEVCFVPLNASYKVHAKMTPFMTRIRPVMPIDNKAAGINQKGQSDFLTAPDAVDTRTQFENWCEFVLNLKKGKKIQPLVHDWSANEKPLRGWLESSFDALISRNVRDLMGVASYMNDRLDFYGKPAIFVNHKLSGTATRMGVELIDRSSLSANCLAIISTYQEMMKFTL